jgi:hypothetical protein
MSCPFFLPVSRLADFVPGPMPLGDCYGGECSADPGALIPIDTLRHCCNLGYARGSCERAARSEADAARFMIKSDSAGSVLVAWAMERNHHPVAVGTVTFPLRDECSLPVERQARAYVDSYLRSKGRA